MPDSRSARAAPASTTSRPCAGLAYLSHSLKLDVRTACGGKRVPSASPAAARAITPARVPFAITAGIPAAVAISAATTFERMPPDPIGDALCPIWKPSSTL